MKKSSFLHNPKDMLSRTFKPAKCKMSLKLAASRIKLLKNKKEVQVKQMKRELAQLLDSGQDQTARIRVEHVIREEKMMAAYDLIEIYCELIVARLQIIETQKFCPIDLKEAITSVIFASPRCGDIPELLDIRKHFTLKYGKEFTSAAIDLRPDCGVSRMLVEKLSAKAPDGPTKLKALTAIAEEHNIKWDPKTFGESETLPNDLLNGPSTFENATQMHAESPHFVADIQAPPSHPGMHNQPLDSSEQNVRSPHPNQNLPSQVGGVSNVASSMSQPERRRSGTSADRAGLQPEFHGEGSAFSFGEQSWNMDFKDATSAAQAAAESAERASMAARAAAELSSRGRVTGQHASESHRSDVRVHRDEGTRKHSTSKHTNDYHPKDSANNISFAERHPRVRNEQNTKSERPHQDDNGSDIRAQTFSSRSKGSFDKNPFVVNVQGANEHSQKSLSREEGMGAAMDTYSDKSEAECRNHLSEDFSSEKFDYYGEERIKRQSSVISSGSHSSGFATDDKTLHDFGEDHSAGIDGHIHRDSLQSGSHDNTGVMFDESGSDGEDFRFETVSHHEEFYVPSPDRNLTAHLSADTGTGSPFKMNNSQERSQSEFSTKRNSSHEFSGSVEATTDRSRLDNFGPVTFDDSDSQDSDDETNIGHSWLRGTKDSESLHGKENPSLGSPGSLFAEKTSGGSPQNFGSGEAPTNSSPRQGKAQVSNDNDSEPPYYNSMDEVNRHDSSQSRFSLVHEVNDNVNSSHSHRSEMDDENSGYGKELNFEKLTGGLRHKGYKRPPFIRSQVDNISSSSRKGDEESPTVILQSDAFPAVGSSSTGNSKLIGNARRSRVPNSHYDSDSDSSEEEFEKQPSGCGQEPYTGSTYKDVKAKSNSRGPVTYFHSESSDSEDDSAKQVFTGRSRLGAGVSRRTKASPSSSGSISHLKGRGSSVVLETSDSVAERNPSTNLYGAETQQPSQSQKKHSGHMRDLLPSSSGKVGSKTTMESKILSNENRESHGPEQPPNSKQTQEASGSAETQKISFWNSINREDSGKKASHVVHPKQMPDSAEPQKTASRNPITREDSGKKASHVHPKLPDYETLAARFQALRTNHQ